MYKFDEAKYLEIGHKTAADLELAEKAADAAVVHGFDNIFMVGVGGSMAMLTAASVVWKQMSNTPVYLEHAAELMTIGNRQLTEKSLIITVSKSGDTKRGNSGYGKAEGKRLLYRGIYQQSGQPDRKEFRWLCTGSKGGSSGVLLHGDLYLPDADFPETGRNF